MKVRRPGVTDVTGEALCFREVDGEVYFDVVWYGRPGVQTIHHTEVETCSSSSSSSRSS